MNQVTAPLYPTYLIPETVELVVEFAVVLAAKNLNKLTLPKHKI